MGVVVNLFLFVFHYTLFNVYFVSIALAIGLIKAYLMYTRSDLICPGRINGKTVLVTGANTGLGLEISKTLAKRGARVLMACRNMGSAHQAKQAVINETGSTNIDIKQVDLSSLWSVRQLAKNVKETEDRLDLLIHAAGVAGVRNSRTRDDLQITWQVNYLGPFLLTNLLIGMLKESDDARIIYLSSTLHHFHKLNIQDLNCDYGYNGLRCIADTNFANILTANLLAKKLKDTSVTVNTVNPGLVNVPMFRRIKNQWFHLVFKIFMDSFAKTLEEGAATVIMLAVNNELRQTTGQYFSNCKVSSCLSKSAHDMGLAENLWRKSAQLVDLQADETPFKNQI